MSGDIVDKCEAFLNSVGYTSDQPLIVAVSGGLDSMCLASVLLEAGAAIQVAHCNFKLRIESDEESEMVKRFFEANQVPVHTKELNAAVYAKENHVSIQVAARKLRYAWFTELAADLKCSFVATAHHAEDETETLVLNLIKGNSPALLKGIPRKRDIFIRPFLDISRREILHFAKRKNIPWMEDASNRKNIYERNLIRNELLPLIRKLNPSFSSHLLDLYQRQKMQSGVLRDLLETEFNSFFSQETQDLVFDSDAALNKLGLPAVTVLLSFRLEEMGWSGHQASMIIALLEAPTGKRAESRKWIVWKDRGKLIFSERTALQFHEIILTEADASDWSFDDGRIRISVRKSPEVPRFFLPQTWILAGDSLRFPLTIRHWKEGDRMMPLGMKGLKKLSDIFVDEKFNAHQKRMAIVVEDQEKIIALSGFRISELCRVKPETQFVYEIDFHQS